MKWQEKETAKLISLYNEKLSYYEIAEELNRSYGSVRLKLQKMGLKTSILTKIKVPCLSCGSDIDTTIFSEKKFCNNSCAAIYNNKLRKTINYCANCKTEISIRNKYCSKDCETTHHRDEYFKRIESGDITLSDKQYKKYLIHKYGDKCMECGWCEINPVTNKIPIQLEHIDGNSENNNLNNLKLLCPNCHSLTPTFGALNKGNGREQRRLKRQNKNI
jgi:uncharacterized protein YwgA